MWQSVMMMKLMMLMVVCHSLLEQMKSPRMKAVVGVLQVAKSKALKKWKELVSQFLLSTLTCICTDLQNQLYPTLVNVAYPVAIPIKVTLKNQQNESLIRCKEGLCVDTRWAELYGNMKRTFCFVSF